jgi:hypothetical protein
VPADADGAATAAATHEGAGVRSNISRKARSKLEQKSKEAQTDKQSLQVSLVSALPTLDHPRVMHDELSMLANALSSCRPWSPPRRLWGPPSDTCGMTSSSG